MKIRGGDVLDLRGMTTAEAASLLDEPNLFSIGIDEWLPRTPSAMDTARSRGHLWAKVDESFPIKTTTMIWLGTGADDVPELTEIGECE